jgi:hypothetical protein
MLSCSWDYEADRYAEAHSGFAALSTKRARRCRPCKLKIKPGDTCLKFYCCRDPRSDYEENRFGGEVPMADAYLCESCGEIFFNLYELGCCVGIGHNMREKMRDYWEMTGFDPEKYMEAQP